MPWGTPDEVVERVISSADHAGANTVTVSLNRGAMPHEMFMHQIRRFASEEERVQLYNDVYQSDRWKNEIGPRVGDLIDREQIKVTRLVATPKSVVQ